MSCVRGDDYSKGPQPQSCEQILPPEVLGEGCIFLINNSYKNCRQYAEKTTRLGLPVLEEKVFTSGEATALYLQREQPASFVYVVGTPALKEGFRPHGFALEDTPQGTVPGFDTTLTYQKLCDFFGAQERNISGRFSRIAFSTGLHV